MRGFLLWTAVLAAAAMSAQADPHNLAGGALIAHNAGYYGRYQTPNCETYFQYNPITSCDEQNNTMESGNQYAWFVIAAFDEDKEWCGVQFGFDNFDPLLLAFVEYAPCFPGLGLEIPSGGWPGPLEGTSFVIRDTPWTGNWLPVYWFHVYAYGYNGPGLVQLIPDPSVPVHFGGFCNCGSPPHLWDAALGGMGVDQPGTWVCWGWHESVCCIGTDCAIVLSEHECTGLGGEYHPEWTSCGPPNPCGATPAATTTWGSLKQMYR